MKLKIFIFYLLILSSCTSKRTFTGNTTVETNCLSLAKVTSLYVKKADVHLNAKDLRIRVKMSLKIQKNEFIQISLLAPLGYEAMRIFLTPDQLSFINFHDKSYYSGDYPEYGIFSIGFDFFQSIFLNQFTTGLSRFPDNIVSDNDLLKINYSNFIDNNSFMYPLKTDIKFKSDKFLNSLRFEFVSVVLDQQQHPTFKIPSHYKKIADFSYSGF